VVASVALAACADDTDAEPVGTGTVPGSTPPTSSPPTTAAPTTDAPTTTLDEAAQLAAEVEADLRETFRLTDEAFFDPTNDVTVAAALEGHIATSRELLAQRLQTFRTDGWVTRENPAVAAGIIVETPATLLEPSEDVARVQVCEIDPWIVVEPGAGPNGGDAIVDSNIYAYRSILFVRRIDDRWRIEGADQLGEWTGLGSCPAE
jgi:hypothetical protein